MISRMSDAGLLVGEVRPVNAYLHLFESVVPD
jgi:hypothetical protein